MFDEQKDIEYFRDLGIIQADGYEEYIDEDKLFSEFYSRQDEMDYVSQKMANLFVDDDIDVVIGSGITGAVLAQSVVFQWGTRTLANRKARAVFADRINPDYINSEYIITHGFEKIIPQSRILFVEDFLMSQSIGKVVAEALRLGGIPVGIATIYNVGKISREELGLAPEVRFESIL